MSRRASISRDQHGVAHVLADDDPGLLWGMGWCHARDRGMQMLLMRILGYGRASELLESRDTMLGMDRFFRQMHFYGGADSVAQQLPQTPRDMCQAYCDGVNAVISMHVPWELKFRGYRPEPWTIADSIVLSRMAAYLSLAQSQAEVERLLLQLVQARVSRALLDELFPGILKGLDEELIRKVKLGQKVIPDAVRWNPALPVMAASNNWVISGAKTGSGKPILANDPHLEVNRLPAVWYEIVLKRNGWYAMGATMPGLPAMIIGRTPDLAWGVTYPFMDAVDSWVEHCRAAACFREPDQWIPLRQRKEIIRRKKKPPVEVTFYENEHGILDGDPFEEGYYLATRWSGSESGVASVVSFVELLHATDVPQAMKLMGNIESNWNWILADRHGSIGYQMSGLMPRRREGANGFLPLPGWSKETDWDGFFAGEDLPRCLNPECGFLITANENLNAYGREKPTNIAMGDHRARRIRSLLSDRTALTAADMFAIQYDVYSLQAERFMAVLRPLLPESYQGKILEEWDCRYTADSRGAFLFEQVYHALLREVFGKKNLGEDVMNFLSRHSSMVPAFFSNFDNILLSENSAWFAGENRDELFRRIACEILRIEPRKWGEAHQFSMQHMMFQGRLPRFLGFDRGPFQIEGGRATVLQTQIFHSRGRFIAVAPSYRMVTDFGADQIHTNLPGGPSDRRFSRGYASDVRHWLEGRYKTIRG